MDSQLKRTPLFEAHRQAGARLMEFGSWEMPAHYGSQIEEHHAVRQRSGIFDVSHMLAVDVQGTQAREYLRQLLANDIDRVRHDGQAIYTCMLNAQGGVVDDLIVSRIENQPWRLVLNAGCADKDLAWMQSLAQDYDVQVIPRHDLAMVAIQGPQAKAALMQVRPAWQTVLEGLPRFTAAQIGDTQVSRTGYTGEDGYEVALPASEVQALWDDLIAAQVQPCGLGARDTLRLEAGLPLYGHEMTETVLPVNAGLQWTVCLRDAERDFTGRQAVETTPQSAQLMGLVLQARGVMRAEMLVKTEFGPGEVTSGTMSPTLGVSVAMARLPLACKAGDAVTVEIRGQAVPAVICALPFVRNGKAQMTIKS